MISLQPLLKPSLSLSRKSSSQIPRRITTSCFVLTPMGRTNRRTASPTPSKPLGISTLSKQARRSPSLANGSQTPNTKKINSPSRTGIRLCLTRRMDSPNTWQAARSVLWAMPLPRRSSNTSRAQIRRWRFSILPAEQAIAKLCEVSGITDWRAQAIKEDWEAQVTTRAIVPVLCQTRLDRKTRLARLSAFRRRDDGRGAERSLSPCRRGRHCLQNCRQDRIGDGLTRGCAESHWRRRWCMRWMKR